MLLGSSQLHQLAHSRPSAHLLCHHPLAQGGAALATAAPACAVPDLACVLLRCLCLLTLQLAAAAAMLQQLQDEHAELTRVLIDAKVEIAEKKGEQLA